MAINSETLRFIIDLKDNASKGLLKVEKSVDVARAGFKRLQSTVFSLSGALAGVSLGIIAKDLFDVGTEVQGLERAFKLVTGSAEGAKAELAFLREETNRLGLEFYESADAFKSISAAAKGTALEGDAVRKIFVGMGEAATVLNLSSEQTTGALRALEQMISKGNVQAEELRGQLGERLPGAFALAAKAMGVSTQELNKMLDNGEVLASELLPRLADALHEQFGEAAAEASGDARQALNRFRTAWKDLRVLVSESGFLDVATDSIKRLTDALKDPETKAAIAELSRGLADLASKGVDIVVSSTKNLLAVYQSLPPEIVGAAGYGIIGRVIFGGWGPAKIAATIVLIKGNLDRFGFGLDDYKKSSDGLFYSLERIWEVVSGQRDWNTGLMNAGAAVRALGADFDAINKEIEAATAGTIENVKAAVDAGASGISATAQAAVDRQVEINTLLDESLEIRKANHAQALAEIAQQEALGVVSAQEAADKKLQLEIDFLAQLAQETAAAYEKIREDTKAKPEDIAKAKAAALQAETAHLEKIVELHKTAAERRADIEKDTQEKIANIREAGAELREAQFEDELHDIELLYRKELISYEEMVERKLEAEVEFLEWKLRKVEEDIGKLAELDKQESAEYIEAQAEKIRATNALEDAVAKLNTLRWEGVDALEAEEAAIRKSTEALREKTEATEEAKEASEGYIEHLQAAAVEMEGATDKEIDKLQELADAIYTYEEMLKSNTDVIARQAIGGMLGSLKREYDALVKVIEKRQYESRFERYAEQQKKKLAEETDKATEAQDKQNAATQSNTSLLEQNARAAEASAAAESARTATILTQAQALQGVADQMASIKYSGYVTEAIEALSNEFKQELARLAADISKWQGQSEGGEAKVGMAGGGPIHAAVGRFIRRPFGKLPGVDTGKDHVPVLARGGEWFIRNEAADFWSRIFGAGFMPAINAPWSDAGRRIVEAVKSGMAAKRAAGGPVFPMLRIPAPRLAGGPEAGTGAPGPGWGPMPWREMGRLELSVGGTSYPVAGEVETLRALNQAFYRARKMRG